MCVAITSCTQECRNLSTTVELNNSSGHNCVENNYDNWNSEVEKYVKKVFDEIFNNEIDKGKIVEKFLEKFEKSSKENIHFY